jgi:nucleoside-diphosphate-sugar epimerase
MSRPRVLITGAASAIGTELVAALAPEMEVLAGIHRVTDLVRNDGHLYSSPSVKAIAIDITAPRLGLGDETYRSLQNSLDLIVHAAAVTDFGRPEGLYEKVNRDGTQHVLELAGGVIPLVHMSTAYVCGERADVVLESELDAGQRFANAYERTKFEAERLVQNANRSGSPAAIVRPSIVVGTARRGVTRTFKNVYVLLRLLTEGRVRSIPISHEATLDLVPIDYVVAATAEVARRPADLSGAVFHLTGGCPLALRDVSEVLAEYPPFQMPRFIPAPVFDLASLSAIERKYYERVVRLYEPYFQRRMQFSTIATEQLLENRPRSGGKPFLRNLLDYCLRVGYLGASRPHAEAVLGAYQQPEDSHRRQKRGAVG